jgi:membrane protease YdiL (CAAX protease family)
VNKGKKIMEVSIGKKTTANDKESIPQLKFGTILMLFAWPALWYTLLIYGFGRLFIPEGGTTPSWLLLAVIALGGGAELCAGLLLLKREGYPLTVNGLRNRIRLSWPMSWKAWASAVIVLILALSLSMALGPVNTKLAGIPGFQPPQWWGNAANPLVKISGASDVFPDVQLQGNFLFATLYFLIGLTFNIIGEEIYYRGYLLPRMRGIFGRWDWVANGFLFTLKHVYQRWLYPGVLVGGLAFAFSAGPLRSLPLAMVFHWIGNYLIQMIFLIQAVLCAA